MRSLIRGVVDHDALLEKAVSWSLIASVFFLPISSSLFSVSLTITLGLMMVLPRYQRQSMRFLRQPWFFWSFFLVGLSFAACLWTQAPFADASVYADKYSKLLFVPGFVLAFQSAKVRSYALHAFILAMLLTCVVSWAKIVGWSHYHGDEAGHVFRNHIITGYMMALAAYVCVGLALLPHQNYRLGYALLALLFSYHVLFIGMGRTSYLTYLMLMSQVILQHASWRRALTFALGLLVLLGVIYQCSGVMQQRTQEAVHDWSAYHQQIDKNTPVGFRLQFHDYAYGLFKQSPWLGLGTGGFGHAFQRDQPVPSWGTALFEPHSQYWLVAVDWGLVGVGALFLYGLALVLAIHRVRETRWLGLGLISSFCLGCCFDSLLLYSSTGYFFLLLMALCLAAGDAHDVERER